MIAPTARGPDCCQRPNTMAIRFACPSCQQPIEVDDQWGGQAVACPYCRRAVTAPTISTWLPGPIPQAKPTGLGLERPPPLPGSSGIDAGVSRPVHCRRAPSCAAVALTLAVASAVLCLLGMLVWAGAVIAAIEQRHGPQPSEAQVRQALQEMRDSQQIPRPRPARLALLAGAVCALVGLATAIRSLLRQERRRAMAIIACAACGWLACGQVIGVLALTVSVGR